MVRVLGIFSVHICILPGRNGFLMTLYHWLTRFLGSVLEASTPLFSSYVECSTMHARLVATVRGISPYFGVTTTRF